MQLNYWNHSQFSEKERSMLTEWRGEGYIIDPLVWIFIEWTPIPKFSVNSLPNGLLTLADQWKDRFRKPSWQKFLRQLKWNLFKILKWNNRRLITLFYSFAMQYLNSFELVFNLKLDLSKGIIQIIHKSK